MNILGINAYHGNASAAIVCDGRLIAAVEEERFNRVKYAAGFPTQAIRYCLKEAGLTLQDIDHVAVPRNPYARLGTKLFYALRMPSFARERVKVLAKFTGIPEALAAAFDADPKKIGAKFHRIEHHQAHLASSFFVSPFERAALLSAEIAKRLGAVRASEEPLEERHRNLASSLQTRLEEVYLGMLKKLGERTGLKAVCLAGGVAFNCVANGKIFDATPFERVYVHPAAGDAGLAVGAAYFVWHQKLGEPRSFVMDHPYWGPGYTREEIRRAIDSNGLAQSGYSIVELTEEELSRRGAAFIADGKILGWFQGRAAWGPRALGHRSIVADPRRPGMKEILNRRIKHRQIFRPVAPSILAENTAEYFEKSHASPFMTLAYSVRQEKRGKIPAPTHVDGTGRLQTVAREANPRYHALISAFRDLTGVPVVLNTSFNDN